MTAATANGPRYALALYDGDRLMGFMPQLGDSIVHKPDDAGIDLFHSELGVRSQARRLAIKFAPLTVAPFDLAENCPLDPIVNPEEGPVPLRDEETREPSAALRPNGPTLATVDDGDGGRGVPAGSAASARAHLESVAEASKFARRPAERAELRAMARNLAASQYLLAQLLERLETRSEG